MSLRALWDDPDLFYWVRLFLIFIATLTGCNFLANVAWRAALRDTNGEKRRQILQKLGRLNDGRMYMFVGFLHPYSHGGGGGERVLFEAIKYQQQTDANIICVVYTGDISPLQGGVSKEDMLARAKERFGLEVDASRLHFLPLRNRYLVSDTFWPAFTLAGQAYGANRLGYEALGMLVPDVFIDTTGYAFALSPVKNFSKQVRVGAYVHYPTISTDMLRRVRNREAGVTNSSWIAAYAPVSWVKYVYYRIFAAKYGAALRKADVIVCNGTWTHAHIQDLLQYRVPRPWSTPQLPTLRIVHPPCDTESFAKIPLDHRQTRWMVSVAQFRPEKDHELQLRILRGLLDKHPELKSSRGADRPLRLILIGSCRNEADQKRLASLKALAKELLIENHLEWHIDAPYSVLLEKMRQANIGLSTMVDEHFGIAVVEFMAAGLLTLSHASAGPMQDIAVPVDGMETGFHARTLDEYVKTAYRLMCMPADVAMKIRQVARTRATTTFSDTEFQRSWRKNMWDELVPPELIAMNNRLLAERAKAQQRLAAASASVVSTPASKTQTEEDAVPDAPAGQTLSDAEAVTTAMPEASTATRRSVPSS
ncbi:asparagine-linked glycosylation protein [Malassezia pachydermatis]|uniref:GDP-Man:Man(3)GlcNAc(2)-PP-Dol alpha-1,2-mannosyltransferase n=1 Tax=Malassezia pachydermatis TaxID=77020 RepID=A0A0M8MIN4_9BASI|nr:glycosyltransferase family 4 protein [Malassezia pachydermatis]KOS13236.1 glycosyltransferase family 4 protein [Malassezia pachydermatis]